MLAFASVISSGSVLAEDTGMIGTPTVTPVVLPAPIGHVQPTQRDFSSNSTGNDIEQHRLSAFDAKQHQLDEMLDKKLNICRGC
ncbi:MAG: hypothetical protein QOE39_1060 [Bradyrhizobium sp.]|nr:hypothetical protein [Bradyrhizobium sp.]